MKSRQVENNFTGKGVLLNTSFGKSEASPSEVLPRIVTTAQSLINGRKNSINFSARLAETNPGLSGVLIPDRIGRSARYTVKDPERFFYYLKNHPEDFTFDCLNVLPAVQYLVISEILMEAGFPASEIFRMFEYSTMHGNRSAILAFDNGKIVEHRSLMNVSRSESSSYNDPEIRGYATDVFAQDILVGNWRNYKPRKGKIPLKSKFFPGNHFHMTHHGTHALSTHHNYDDWNGFVIKPGKDILKSRGLLLAQDPNKRLKYFSDVAQELLKRLPVHGIDRKRYKDYQQRGGLQLVVVNTDYDRLVSSLSNSLRGKI